MIALRPTFLAVAPALFTVDEEAAVAMRYMCSFGEGFATLSLGWQLGGETMEVRLSATPKGNGFQATITYSDGVSVSSAEAFSSVNEAILAAATKLLAMPERLPPTDDPTCVGASRYRR